MTGTIWWLWLGATGLGLLLMLALMIYALEKSFGIFSSCYGQLEGTKKEPQAPSMPFTTSPVELRKAKAEEKAGSEETNADFNITESIETDSGDYSDVLEGTEERRPLRWVRACKCQGPCQGCAQRWMPNPASAARLITAGKDDVVEQRVCANLKAMTVPSPVDLAWHALSCRVVDRQTGQEKDILQPCSGVVAPGELCALVGPSGAGKSTLLDILAACQGAGRVGGVLRMNGKRLGARFKRVSAYVEQDDVFVPTMTCWETLLFHATLRTGREVGRGEVRERMQRVLKVMGLWRVRGTTVGGTLPGGIFVRGLSGGEKRRLTIACSLIGRPSLLFLDEPTSGLDSFAALNVMEHLSQLASMGHTIIASVHQPRATIWDMFHKVVVLSEGCQLYFGSPDNAVKWFDWGLGYPYDPDRDGSPSDWLIDLISVGFHKPPDFARRTMTTREHVVAAAQHFRGHKVELLEDEEILAELSRAPLDESIHPPDRLFQRWYSVYPSSWWRQFCVLSQRGLYIILRNPSDASSRTMLAVSVGLISGAIAWNLDDSIHTAGARMGVLFFENVILALLPFSYMSIYFSDRQFYAADVATGLYHPSAYYLAQTLTSLPFMAINTLLSGYITYGMVGLRYTPYAMAIYGVFLVLVSLCATQVLILSAYIMPTQDLAFILSTFYVTSSILLMGFFIRLDQIRVLPMRWMSYLVFPRWAFEGLLVVEMKDRIFWPKDCPDGHLRPGLGNAPPPPASLFARFETGGTCYIAGRGEVVAGPWLTGLSVAQIGGILLGFYFGFHVLSYLALAYLYKRKR